jgi:AcrR family transcriptional regulator
MGAPTAEDDGTLSRAERKRRERERRFVDAAKRIVADEGFEALTMQRLSDDLDMAVSAVYRYFPSKGALIRQVQLEAIEQLARSLGEARARLDRWSAGAGLTDDDVVLVRLVLIGRWLCAASATYPEDLRLLQMIMSQRSSALDPDGGWKVLPVAMDLVGQAVEVIGDAERRSVISPGNAVERAVILASALGGVLQTDDLEEYVPELFGQARLAVQANLDLLAGWGADRDALSSASGLVDDLAADGPLAP